MAARYARAYGDALDTIAARFKAIIAEHGAEALAQTRPGPGLELAVPRLALPAGGLEVLEPGVRLLDEERLLAFFRLHAGEG